MKINNYEKLTPYDILPSLNKVYLKTAGVAVFKYAVSGFAAAGIWPVSPDTSFDQYVASIEMLYTDQCISNGTSASQRAITLNQWTL